MKLNKEICKKCYNKNDITWSDICEESIWNAGYVYCLIDYDEEEFSINEMPHKCCPFKLEHIVSDNEIR